MKLKHLLLLGGLAGLGYLAYQKRQEISQSTKGLISDGQQLAQSSMDFQSKLDNLQEQIQLTQETMQDLPYKLKTFNQLATARLEEITQIWEKYQDTEEN